MKQVLFTELETQACPVARVAKPAPERPSQDWDLGVLTLRGQCSSRVSIQGRLEVV